MASMIGYLLMGFSLFVLVTTFPSRMGIVIMPDLVPMFGVTFAVIYLVAQYALAVYYRSIPGIILVTGVAIIAGFLGWVSREMGLVGDIANHSSSAARHVLCMASCAAGAVLGLALVKQWIVQRDQFSDS